VTGGAEEGNAGRTLQDNSENAENEGRGHCPGREKQGLLRANHH
jgi:hypothetical protein